jgi:two-component system phosphate regulon sensor histidine kinase PhoR
MNTDPFESRSPTEQVAVNRRRRMLLATITFMLYVTGPISLPFVIMVVTIPVWQSFVTLLVVLLVFPVMLLARWLARRENTLLGGYLTLTYLLLLTAINGMLIKGLYPAVAPAFAPIIVIAGMVLGPRGSYLTAGTASVLWAAGWLITTTGLVPTVTVPSPLLTTVAALIIMAAFVFTAHTSHLARQDLNRSLDEATYDLVQANCDLAGVTAELRQITQRTEAILNNSPDAILLLKVGGNISVVNPSFTQLYGYDIDEVHGRPLISLIDREDADRVVNALQAVSNQLTTQRLEVKTVRSDGRTFDTGMALAPIKDEVFMKGIVCSIRDISPLKEIERMKDAFVSNVSHELRTPVTSLKLNLKLLELSPEKQSTYVEKLRRDTDRLNNIIEDLLDLSRLEQDRLRVEVKSVNLNVLASQHVQDRTALAQARSITLTYQGAPGLPPVAGDEQLLEQILSVLLTNALNYTQPGGVVEVRTFERVEGDTSWVGFSVRDDGPGISPQDQAHLFERFYRGSAGVKSGFPGTGLGLAIAREIVERHAGHIEVKSNGVPGEGATFTVWLPVVEPFA